MGYGLVNSGICTGFHVRAREFSLLNSVKIGSLGCTQFPIQWVQAAISSEVKWLR
jgi:hypothetical protein